MQFIGITDFTKQEETEDMLSVLQNKNTRLSLGVGVMMSYKTLHKIPSKWTNVFPKNEDVSSIFIKDSNLYNVLHYADYDESDFYNSIILASEIGGKNIDAVQLDMVWPDPNTIINYRKHYSNVDVILQVGKNSFDQINNNVDVFIEKINRYDFSINGILLDRSMGRGIPINADLFRPFIESSLNKRPDLKIVVAGGLGPYTINLIEPLVKDYPMISIDAQSKLRLTENAKDPIDWNMAKNYLICAIDLFNKYL